MHPSNGNEVATIDRIKQVAFRFFLEKGYEATNLRKVSDEVGIKASSIYFYYESKQALFFSIFEELFERQLKVIQEVKEKKQNESAKEQIYFVFQGMIDDCICNSAEYKFQIRYKMFPVEELAEEIRLFYSKWQEKEFQVCSTMIERCITSKETDFENQVKLMYTQFRGFCNSMIYEILLSGITMKEELLRIHWEQFFINAFEKNSDIEI